MSSSQVCATNLIHEQEVLIPVQEDLEDLNVLNVFSTSALFVQNIFTCYLIPCYLNRILTKQSILFNLS